MISRTQIGRSSSSLDLKWEAIQRAQCIAEAVGGASAEHNWPSLWSLPKEARMCRYGYQSQRFR